MIKLRDAIKLSQDELKEIKKDIILQVKKSDLNAYISDDFTLNAKSGGVPILIKDNINVKGWEITCASKILQGYKSPYNARVIENLQKHNLAPFGRANMDEFAMGSTGESSCYGATKNPLDLERSPGGSSSGSAAAVAGGLAIAALGSDTGGSIRQPAGFCGCVGLKPTYGSVSRYGLIAYSSSLDQIGPITQDVEDCALLFDYIKGYDEKDSTSSKKMLESTNAQSTLANLNAERKCKIGILKSFLNDASADVKNSYLALVERLKAMGNEIVEIEILDTNYHISSYYITAMAEASANLARFDGVRYGNRPVNVENLVDLYTQTRSNGFGSEVKRRILVGNFVLSSGYYDAYYLKAKQVRDFISYQFSEIFKSVDVILSPIAPSVAPKLGESLNPLEMYLSDIYTIGVNLAGLPAICIPVAKSSENLPLGIQFIGNYFSEQILLDMSLSVEKELQKNALLY